MKSLGFILCYMVGTLTASPQGLVNFFNDPTTPVSTYGYPNPIGPMSGPSGSYYFGLLTAPVGTVDSQLFTFSGIYATNTGVTGLFNGGSSVAVPGWAAGTSRDYFVAGWSANLGHNWNPIWLTMRGGPISYFGTSGISQGVAGGFDGMVTRPPLDLFNSVNGLFGFELTSNAVPEPSAIAIGVLGSLLALGSKRTPMNRTPNQRHAPGLRGHGRISFCRSSARSR